MPIYEFHCQACDCSFETLVRNSSEKVTCKQCSSPNIKKLISAHAIGSGIAETACGSAPCSPRPPCGAGGCPSSQL
ncbi:MAG: zinc ribbon domain-containing protein [Mariprofundus sp.]|nr:zinc ribbon domain-containing protein [Mariprofundus sp.]